MMGEVKKFKSRLQLDQEHIKHYKKGQEKDIIKALELYEIEPPEHFKTGKPRRVNMGDCFRKALKYLWDINDSCPEEYRNQARLIHGIWSGYLCELSKYEGMPPAEHAWVELPGGLPGVIVFDGVLQRFYKQADYHKVNGCIKEIEYTVTEASKLGAVNGHWGPWHKLV